MTRWTSGMSRPLAATSVATRAGVRPLLKASKLEVRAVWVMSPWMATQGQPLPFKKRSRRAHSRLYKAKTMTLFRRKVASVGNCFSRTRMSSSSLRRSSTTLTTCDTLLFAAKASLVSPCRRVFPLLLTKTKSAFKNSSAATRTSDGHVAENMAVCLLSFLEHCPAMSRTAWTKPMSSMRSASSRHKNSTADKSKAKSSKRPGVATSM
mmetsp:Transcript_29678/g.95679  ORF Transcript_29678/g.95679 Transcript_29678/m.95679 type:complete len:208 (+) Transcript_29678:345-968(+)